MFASGVQQIRFEVLRSVYEDGTTGRADCVASGCWMRFPFHHGTSRPGESFDSVLARAMAALQDTGATLVSMDILGLPFASGLAAVEAVTGPLTWPLLWIAGPRLAEAGGIQLWAESEAAVSPVQLRGQVVGSVVDLPAAMLSLLAESTDESQPARRPNRPSPR